MVQLGFSGGSVGENLPANEGDLGSISGSGISPGEGNGNPLQYSCLGNPQGQKSLVAYNPWGHKGIRHNLVTKQQWYSHPTEYYTAIKNEPGTSLVVRWLSLYSSNVRGEGPIPAGGTKIPHALQYCQKKTKTKIKTTTTSKWMNSHRHYS